MDMAFFKMGKYNEIVARWEGGSIARPDKYGAQPKVGETWEVLSAHRLTNGMYYLKLGERCFFEVYLNGERLCKEEDMAVAGKVHEKAKRASSIGDVLTFYQGKHQMSRFVRRYEDVNQVHDIEIIIFYGARPGSSRFCQFWELARAAFEEDGLVPIPLPATGEDGKLESGNLPFFGEEEIWWRHSGSTSAYIIRRDMHVLTEAHGEAVKRAAERYMEALRESDGDSGFDRIHVIYRHIAYCS